jgi:hypothetical protein
VFDAKIVTVPVSRGNRREARRKENAYTGEKKTRTFHRPEV